MLHPSACALFGYPYTETNRFVKPIFDNALRTFLAFDIYRYGTPCRLSHLSSILALRNRSLRACVSFVYSSDISLLDRIGRREREREKYLISNRERNRWQMIRNIANCQVLLKKREQSGTSIGRTLQSARLIARFIPFRPL